ncbi:MAG: hypothetical protein ACFFA5_10895 [Promethearchaeota archaeon]
MQLGSNEYEVILSIVSGLIGIIVGSVSFYFSNKILEDRKVFLSTKRDQLKYVFAPLDILVRINGMEFERYLAPKTTIADKEYIEKNVWYPNHQEIKEILMKHAHLLNEVPDVLLELLNHINVWLSEYKLVYEKKSKKPPVFVKYKGYSYPRKVDDYIKNEAAKLRKLLNL